MDSGHIPIIQGLGITPGGQMLALDINHVMACVSREVNPLKVMLVNTTGGLTNEFDEVIFLDFYRLSEYFFYSRNEKILIHRHNFATMSPY